MSLNRLGAETSPYLQQHKDNPVHWQAWGPEALAEAKRTGKPILLSVGYAACHWCHVMAHESFEDETAAAVMNELFVNIKVDREERPDVDAIYMSALHSLGQQGGWPLTMFLDSDARPFWGGTYFPPQSRWGKPAFTDVLREVARIFREEPEKVENNSAALTSMLSDKGAKATGPAITDDLIRDLTMRMVRAVDHEHGGINGAPKFPQWSFFWLLWRGAIRYGHTDGARAVENTLVNICQGGIYDHLGGGFARYSVDERWLAPHFEKMLYDNALLVDLMTEVWRETQNPLFKVRIAETVSWLLAEMVADGGGFAASLDADSEGEEGKFYVWSTQEIRDVLGDEDAAYFSGAYDVTPEGNWEHQTILNRLSESRLRADGEEQRLAGLRDKLLARRTARVRPGWDDKVLADWNGLMIAALARASCVFERPDWLGPAERAFAFVETRMTRDGRLFHSSRSGQAKAPATANDYANMIWAALRLHQATANDAYLATAQRWTDVLDRHYWVGDYGGYSMSADDTSDVIVRLRNAQDEATPNANSIQASNLVALHLLSGEAKYAERAEALLAAFASDIHRNPLSHCTLLAAAMDLAAPQLIVVAGGKAGRSSDIAKAMRRISLPGALQYDLAEPAPTTCVPALAGKVSAGRAPTAFVCLGTQCSPPLTIASELTEALTILRRA